MKRRRNCMRSFKSGYKRLGKHLNKAKEKMDVNKGREKMLMETANSDESSSYNHFQATSDDTLKLTSEDTCISDSTWELKKLLKVNHGLDLPKRKIAFDDKQGSSSAKAKKATIPSGILQWHDDLSSDKQMIVYKGRPGLSSRNATITKPKKPKSMSKHLAPTTPKTREFGIKKAKGDVGGSSDVRRKGKRKMLSEL
ncbi:hypothetical protein Tco_0335809 [Tanacetum coccineum]